MKGREREQHIDDFFKEKLEQGDFQIDASAWEGLEQQLDSVSLGTSTSGTVTTGAGTALSSLPSLKIIVSAVVVIASGLAYVHMTDSDESSLSSQEIRKAEKIQEASDSRTLDTEVKDDVYVLHESITGSTESPSITESKESNQDSSIDLDKDIYSLNASKVSFSNNHVIAKDVLGYSNGTDNGIFRQNLAKNIFRNDQEEKNSFLSATQNGMSAPGDSKPEDSATMGTGLRLPPANLELRRLPASKINQVFHEGGNDKISFTDSMLIVPSKSNQSRRLYIGMASSISLYNLIEDSFNPVSDIYLGYKLKRKGRWTCGAELIYTRNNKLKLIKSATANQYRHLSAEVSQLRKDLNLLGTIEYDIWKGLSIKGKYGIGVLFDAYEFRSVFTPEDESIAKIENSNIIYTRPVSQITTGVNINYQVIPERLVFSIGVDFRRVRKSGRVLNGTLQGYRIDYERNMNLYNNVERGFTNNYYEVYSIGLNYFIL